MALMVASLPIWRVLIVCVCWYEAVQFDGRFYIVFDIPVNDCITAHCDCDEKKRCLVETTIMLANTSLVDVKIVEKKSKLSVDVTKWAWCLSVIANCSRLNWIFSKYVNQCSSGTLSRLFARLNNPRRAHLIFLFQHTHTHTHCRMVGAWWWHTLVDGSNIRIYLSTRYP